ncbi:MAG TPA: carbon storage regulator [Thermotogota bacterium]|nr:carbon storage regulator [Thermotogota bacterium]HRW93026.1 carbon storage regulator [Thermotogota bacterium]
MLVLNRRKDEEIIIETPGGQIVIKVVEVDNRSAKLGIEAPRDFAIYRRELYEKVHRENVDSVLNTDLSKIPHLFGIPDDEDQ